MISLIYIIGSNSCAKTAGQHLQSVTSLWVLALEVISDFDSVENEQVLNRKCKNIITDLYNWIYKS